MNVLTTNVLSKLFKREQPIFPPDNMVRHFDTPVPEGSFVSSVWPRNSLLRAPYTYDTTHKDYDANAARNFPNSIINSHMSCRNELFGELLTMSKNGCVPFPVWKKILRDAMKELRRDPYAAEIFKRQRYIEKYFRGARKKHKARYEPGWVNIEDALFLYWLVRRMNPKTIVQTGVANGLSLSVMTLALVKNRSHGRIYAIDYPQVFDPAQAQWTIEGHTYGAVVPEEKTSGWMVPEMYRDRVEVWCGDAKALLPDLVSSVDSIDFFYHDSDHSYLHMMFEFREALRRLSKGGIIVSDDIAWNSSLWDLADEYAVPAYNFRGSMGVAFF
ncbi:MAG TPA: class I SAM-dependent methyltransferase [Candidatus Obscuribacterales bacterium]